MSGPVVLGLRLLLTASLYAFLAWAFINLWRDIKLQSDLLAARKIPPIRLSINRDDQVSRTMQFDQAELTIGRDPACECPLDDDVVSARHARLSYHHNQWWLEDLASTNGTFFNQEKLAIPTVLVSGDDFRCGKTQFTVSLGSDPLGSTSRKDP